MLYLLRAEPTLLPPVYPTGVVDGTSVSWLIERRRHEGHQCLRCPAVARVAYAAHLDVARWVDLCPACDLWLRENTEWRMS